MKTKEWVNGSNSGKLQHLQLSECLQASIYLKCIKETVFHLYNGSLITGVGMIFPVNSKTDLVVEWRTSDIVTTTIT